MTHVYVEVALDGIVGVGIALHLQTLVRKVGTVFSEVSEIVVGIECIVYLRLQGTFFFYVITQKQWRVTFCCTFSTLIPFLVILSH